MCTVSDARATVERWVERFNAGDAEGISALYAEDAVNHQIALEPVVEIGGVRREFLSMPWQGFDSEGRPRRYFVWGATAGMLRNLYRFLSA